MNTEKLLWKPAELVGKHIDNYYIIEVIGQGGMGTVYKAISSVDNEPIVIKLIKASIAADPRMRRRFQHEIEIASQLQHPHILPILSVSVTEPYLYMVMPFVRNGSLDTLLKQTTVLSPANAHRITEQIASALQYAHNQGIIHRDLKPDNIMLTKGEEVALSDFGIAKLADDTVTQLTSTGVIVGTPTYMSPEQALGYPLDFRSDIYSLGLVLYRMLVGRLPVSATTPATIVNQRIHALPIRPSQINSSFPETLENVLLRTLSRDREDRFGTVDAFMSALRQSMGALDEHTYQAGNLVTEEQLNNSLQLFPRPEIANYLVSLGVDIRGEGPSIPAATVNLSGGSERRNQFFRWLTLVPFLLAIGIILTIGWRQIVQPLQQRAISAEQTAQAAAEQSPAIITQIVTNNAGEPIFIEVTQLVTVSADDSNVDDESANGESQATSLQTTSPPATVITISTSTPTLTSPPPTVTPQQAAAQAVDNVDSSSSASSAPTSPAPAPTDSPTATPLSPTSPGKSNNPPGQGDDGSEPGNSGNPPGQGDDGSEPGNSGNPPGQGNDDSSESGNSGNPPGQR